MGLQTQCYGCSYDSLRGAHAKILHCAHVHTACCVTHLLVEHAHSCLLQLLLLASILVVSLLCLQTLRLIHLIEHTFLFLLSDACSHLLLNLRTHKHTPRLVSRHAHNERRWCLKCPGLGGWALSHDAAQRTCAVRSSSVLYSTRLLLVSLRTSQFSINACS